MHAISDYRCNVTRSARKRQHRSCRVFSLLMQATGLVLQGRHSSLESFECFKLHDVWRKGIPISHCTREERHLSLVYSTVDDLKCSTVAVPWSFSWVVLALIPYWCRPSFCQSYTSYTGVHPFFCPQDFASSGSRACDVYILDPINTYWVRVYM